VKFIVVCFHSISDFLPVLVITAVTKLQTLVPIAWIFVYLGYLFIFLSRDLEPSVYVRRAGETDLFLGFALYFGVWVSILGGGFVNDSAYTCSADAVSKLKYQSDGNMSVADNLLHYRYFEYHRMNVLMRLDVLRNTSGFKFFGSIVSVQKAIAVGSIIITIMNAKAFN